MFATISKIWAGSIKRRLVISIALVHAVLMSLFIYDLVHRQKAFLHRQSNDTTQGLVTALASASVSWVLADDLAGLEEVLGSQGNFPGLQYAMILSPAGRVLAHTERDKVGQFAIDAISQQLLQARSEPQLLVNSPALVDIACPVSSNGRQIGWARAGVSRSSINQEMQALAIKGFTYTAAAIAVGVLIALLMGRGLTRGIVHLVQVAEKIKEGDEQVRAVLQRQDELGDLSDTLNTMLDKIIRQKKMTEEARGELRHTLQQYEALVDRLQETNDQLRDEMVKRCAIEDSLAAEKERLAVTLASIADGVITVDLQGAVAMMNSVAEDLTGWRQQEAQGRPLAEVLTVIGPESELVCHDPINHVMASGKMSLMPDDIALINRAGGSHTISGSCAPIRDGSGVIVGGVFVFRDNSAELAMREQVFKNRKLESVGVLAGGIAHDFNNILTGLLGNISIAKLHVPADSQAMPLLDSAEQASQRARKLTEQLLTFSKGGEPVRQSASLAEIIRETAGFVLSGSSLRGRYEIPENIDWVYMDSGQISQVVHNIVLNAVQALPGAGTISIECANCLITPESNLPLESGPYVQVRISDTGTGIDAAHLSQVFDPYFTTKETGNGLGLAICHSIISKHNGYICAESTPGAGATFTFYLPSCQDHQPQSVVSEEELVPGSGTVLVMDDDDIVRDVVSKMLRSFGYTVLLADDGSKAIDVYQRVQVEGGRIDCVILDLTIPGGMGGKETLEVLLEIDPQVRAIVSSGYSNDPVVANYAAFGFRATVNKPYGVNELLHAVQRTVTAG